MFVGREKELNTLNKLYNKNDLFQFIVMYGRRRVGKTSIINEFIKDKHAVCFTGIEANEKQNLENFSKSISEQISNYKGGAFPVFESYQSALEYVFEYSKANRVILCIDEYPYIARGSESLSSVLQLLIDKYKDSSKLYLILCGSSMSYMEDNVLSYKAPLYGRRTAQMKINPPDFFESCKYISNLSDEDKALAYGIVGGTPQYLLQINDEISMKENIKNIFLDSSSFMFEEPINFLKQEMREPAVYNSIISAVAGGYTKLSEISGKTGYATSACSVYLSNLISLDIMRKETPFGENKSKKTMYSIADNMFRFWHRFIQPNISVISKGAADVVYDYISPHLPQYMGLVFESICMDYLWKKLLKGDMSIAFNALGRWWGTDNNTKSQVEIDIMGLSDDNGGLFCECKWTNKETDVNVLDTLIYRSMLFCCGNRDYYIFSKSGFTDILKDRADRAGNIHLVSYEDMFDE